MIATGVGEVLDAQEQKDEYSFDELDFSTLLYHDSLGRKPGNGVL
jgi:hypothetical protein